jgi:hypothetical protein
MRTMLGAVPKGTHVTKHFVMFATSVVLITGSIASAKSESPSDYQKSGAPTALQSTTPDRPPVVTLPEANAPETSGAPVSETTGHAPKAPLDQGNGNWDPLPVTAPTTQH